MVEGKGFSPGNALGKPDWSASGCPTPYPKYWLCSKEPTKDLQVAEVPCRAATHPRLYKGSYMASDCDLPEARPVKSSAKAEFFVIAQTALTSDCGRGAG